MIDTSLVQELRDKLYAPHSPALWCDLWRTFGRLGASDAVVAAVDYADGHLSGWPDSIRKIRLLCEPDLFRKQVPACMDWVHHIELILEHATFDSFIDWCHSAWCRPVSSLTIRVDSLSSPFVLTLKHIQALLESPAMIGLKQLKLSWVVCESGCFSVLLNSPKMQDLKRLELVSCGNQEELLGIELLAIPNSPFLKDLTHLNISNCGLGNEMFEAILQSPHMRGLHTLLFHGNELNGESPLFESMAKGPVRAFETLVLGGNPGSEKLTQQIVNYPRCGTLKHLDLRGHQLQEESIRSIVEATSMSSLRRLGLCGALATPDCFGALSQTEMLPQLEHLDLSLHADRLSGEGFRDLLDGSLCTKLKTFQLINCDLDTEDFVKLSGHECLQTLETLYIAKNTFRKEAIETLFKSPIWGKQLRKLDLSQEGFSIYPISGEDLSDVLVDAPALFSLEQLELRNAHLTPECATMLTQSEAFSGLCHLDVSYNAELYNEGMGIFLNSSMVRGLSTLRVHHVGFDISGFEALCRCPSLVNLTSLVFGELDLELDGFQAMLEGPMLQHLINVHCSLPGHHQEAFRMLKKVAEPVYLSHVSIEDWLFG